MTTSPSLLVAGLTDERDPALLARAAEVAEAMDLAVYVYYPVVVATLHAMGAEETQARLARCRRELHNALETFRKRGLRAEGCVERRQSAPVAIIDLVATLGPRLVMITPKAHAKLAAALSSDDDFELIRRCPAPLWLVRRFPEDRRTVLAAVNLSDDEDAAGATLNHAVLEIGAELAIRLGREAHVIHATSTPVRLTSVIEAVAPQTLDARHRQAEDRRVRQTHELSRAHGIRTEHVHVPSGDFVDNLREIAEPMAVDLVVVGAIAKTWLKRMLIGGTIERLLEATDTDILVVKSPYAAHSESGSEREPSLQSRR